MKQFSSLKMLSLSQETMYSAFVKPGIDFRLSSVIPTSLQRLILVKFDANFFPVLRELSRDLKFAKFPQLEAIRVDPSNFLRTRIDGPKLTNFNGYQIVYRTNEEVHRALDTYREDLASLFSPFSVIVEISV